VHRLLPHFFQNLSRFDSNGLRWQQKAGWLRALGALADCAEKSKRTSGAGWGNLPAGLAIAPEKPNNGNARGTETMNVGSPSNLALRNLR
jgi:hypothetical protein